MKYLRVGLAVVLLAAPLVGHAWWNEEWKFRKELSFDLTPAGADIAGTPTDIPVLVRLHIGNFTYFGDTKPDGSDLRFIAADDKTPLKFHIERYDPQSQMAFVWVTMPQLAGGSNAEKIFLYYGNPQATSAADSAGSYDKGQAAVFHFSESAGEAAAGVIPQDSTAYKNHASTAAGELYPAALIGGGLRLNGSSALQVSPAPNLRLLPQQGATASAWVRFETAPQDAYVVALEQEGRALILGIAGTNAYAQLTAPAGTVKASQNNSQLAAGIWHHLAVRAGEGRLTLFVDGVEAGATDIDIPEISGTLSLGGSGLGAGGGHFFAGEVDEFQFASVARSADWIRAAARSQGMQAPLLVYGGDTQKDSGDVSYFAITLRNVTVDGWVIIVILTIMFVISMVVMGGKGFYLNRVRKGNSEFLREFHKQRDDPRALDRQVTGEKGKGKDEEEESAFESAGDSQYLTALFSGDRRFGASTLFPLYHHGVREMTKRLEGRAAGADHTQTLSPQSIEAIRATMDASLTRLSQKLSSQMVLLTICISGGPFLGLLGTVVGVMITFAAIAASGDVNINAIAPGTAAALAATVAGLGVAIPCLFGYNYLNTRIKEIVADMRVFVDEFVTQAAENYS